MIPNFKYIIVIGFLQLFSYSFEWSSGIVAFEIHDHFFPARLITSEKFIFEKYKYYNRFTALNSHKKYIEICHDSTIYYNYFKNHMAKSLINLSRIEIDLPYMVLQDWRSKKCTRIFEIFTFIFDKSKFQITEVTHNLNCFRCFFTDVIELVFGF